jgi:hypothetical protein
MKAEFTACHEAIKQAIWLRYFITGLKIFNSISRPIKILL